MKLNEAEQAKYYFKSPPARGAWIEIERITAPSPSVKRRPPHGGRGLKFTSVRKKWNVIVAPRTGGVD